MGAVCLQLSSQQGTSTNPDHTDSTQTCTTVAIQGGNPLVSPGSGC